MAVAQTGPNSKRAIGAQKRHSLKTLSIFWIDTTICIAASGWALDVLAAAAANPDDVTVLLVLTGLGNLWRGCLARHVPAIYPDDVTGLLDFAGLGNLCRSDPS